MRLKLHEQRRMVMQRKKRRRTRTKVMWAKKKLTRVLSGKERVLRKRDMEKTLELWESHPKFSQKTSLKA